MRYYVKNAEGKELICPSLADLHALYSQRFLDDDDLVRPESSMRWVPIGSFKALRGVRTSRREPLRMGIWMAAAAALVLMVLLIVQLLRHG